MRRQRRQRRSTPLEGSIETRRAMRVAPDYWLKWYTAKSLGLGVAVGIIGYLLGKSSR